MLAVHWVDAQSARSNAEDQRILALDELQTFESAEKKLTFDRTEASYSVLRWTVKFNTDFLCSCWKSPKIVKGDEGLSNTSRGTSLR